MRKIFLIIFLNILLLFTNVSESFAFVYTINPNGEAVVSENFVFQNFTMYLFEFFDWNLYVKPLGDGWVNQQDPTVKIPVRNTEITTPDGTFQLIKNTTREIYEGETRRWSSLQFSIKVNNIGSFSPGLYSMDFLFFTDYGGYTLTVQFLIPTNCKITENIPISYINLTPQEVFNLNSEPKNVVDTQINIESNSKWNLYLDTSSLGDLIGDYYFQIISYTGNNVQIPQNKTQMMIGQNYLIATGDKTFETSSGMKIPTTITIRYSLKNNIQKFFKEGQYTNNLLYRVEEK